MYYTILEVMYFKVHLNILYTQSDATHRAHFRIQGRINFVFAFNKFQAGKRVERKEKGTSREFLLTYFPSHAEKKAASPVEECNVYFGVKISCN